MVVYSFTNYMICGVRTILLCKLLIGDFYSQLFWVCDICKYLFLIIQNFDIQVYSALCVVFTSRRVVAGSLLLHTLSVCWQWLLMINK